MSLQEANYNVAGKSWLNPRFSSLTVDNNSTLTSITQPVTSLAAATASQTITASESGQVILCVQGTANRTITMPAAAAGLNYKIVFAKPDGTHTTAFTFAANSLYGSIITGPSSGAILTQSSTSGSTTVTLGATAANLLLGDYLQFLCDGTKWYISGVNGAATAGFAFS